MIFLKQSTASQSLLIGPFVDDTDGVTAETALTISNTDIRLSKNGGNMAAKNSGGGTHDENGWYTITLDATDTDTVGTLQISVAETGALPVYLTCTVLEEAVYDALFAASAAGYAAAGDEMDLVNAPNSTALAAIASDVWSASGRALSDPAGIKKNTALSNFMFLLVDNEDHVTPITGETVTAQRSIDGAAFGACANSVSEVASGMYKINLDASDLNGDVITLRFTSSGADDRLITLITET